MITSTYERMNYHDKKFYASGHQASNLGKFSHQNGTGFDKIVRVGSQAITTTNVLKDVYKSQIAKNVINLLPPNNKNASKQYEGEQHMLLKVADTPNPLKNYSFANFTGPSTNLMGRIQTGDKPINQTDGIAFIHDIDYKLSRNNKDAVRKADERMINKLKEAEDKNLDYPINTFLTKNLMKTKVLSEDYGLTKHDSFTKISPYLSDSEKKILEEKRNELVQEGYGADNENIHIEGLKNDIKKLKKIADKQIKHSKNKLPDLFNIVKEQLREEDIVNYHLSKLTKTDEKDIKKQIKTLGHNYPKISQFLHPILLGEAEVNNKEDDKKIRDELLKAIIGTYNKASEIKQPKEDKPKSKNIIDDIIISSTVVNDDDKTPKDDNISKKDNKPSDKPSDKPSNKEHKRDILDEIEKAGELYKYIKNKTGEEGRTPLEKITTGLNKITDQTGGKWYHDVWDGFRWAMQYASLPISATLYATGQPLLARATTGAINLLNDAVDPIGPTWSDLTARKRRRDLKEKLKEKEDNAILNDTIDNLKEVIGVPRTKKQQIKLSANERERLKNVAKNFMEGKGYKRYGRMYKIGKAQAK